MLRGEQCYGIYIHVYSVVVCCTCKFVSAFIMFSVSRTGMAGVPGTASAIFGAVKDVGANAIMISQVSLLSVFRFDGFLS